MVVGLQVNGDASRTLSVELKDVLQCIDNPENFTWSLLWLNATWDIAPVILDLEEQVNQSKNGLLIDWPDLLILAGQVCQVIEIMLIGDTDPEKLIRYAVDEEMYLACDYSLELADSSYWLMYSKSPDFITKIKLRLPGVKELPEVEQ